mmetsp:Transcript_33393/g.72203  ORF Transcript_33393/g.72203 Transcript_33393/m.72203 type:complete len:221 (+) Transcript_33393:730-1392(+)
MRLCWQVNLGEVVQIVFRRGTTSPAPDGLGLSCSSFPMGTDWPGKWRRPMGLRALRPGAKRRLRRLAAPTRWPRVLSPPGRHRRSSLRCGALCSRRQWGRCWNMGMLLLLSCSPLPSSLELFLLLPPPRFLLLGSWCRGGGGTRRGEREPQAAIQQPPPLSRQTIFPDSCIMTSWSIPSRFRCNFRDGREMLGTLDSHTRPRNRRRTAERHRNLTHGSSS